MFFYLNGYGVPRDVLLDGNYQRYLTAVKRVIDSRYGGIAALPAGSVFLAGGATNPTVSYRTEAKVMQNGMILLGFRRDALRLIENSLDLRGNLEGLRDEIGAEAAVVIFCEYARQDFTRFLARRLFRHAAVVPIKFDGSVRWDGLARLRQLTRLPLRLAAWYSPLIRRLIEYPLRLRFIRRHGGQ